MSNDDLEFEEVEVANGGWAKWPTEGTTYIGDFLSLSDDGGKTYDGDPCPELTLMVDGEALRVTLDKGALRDQVYAAQAKQGDVLRIQRGEDAESKKGQVYQTFKVAVARGAAGKAGSSKSDEPAGF